jgi:hypothetical protein
MCSAAQTPNTNGWASRPSLLRPPTERAVRAAGMRARMHVLDVGCGIGDVSFLVSEIVGPGGSVLGIDLDGGGALGLANRAHAEHAPSLQPDDVPPMWRCEAPEAGDGRETPSAVPASLGPREQCRDLGWATPPDGADPRGYNAGLRTSSVPLGCSIYEPVRFRFPQVASSWPRAW